MKYLNDLPPEDQVEIVRQRKAKEELIRWASMRDNWFASQSEILDAYARIAGIDPNYSEDLDEDEI